MKTTLMFCAAILAAEAVAQPAPAPPRRDFVQAVNETAGAVRLELYPPRAAPGNGVRPEMMACVGPKESVRWELDSRSATGLLRMVAMRDAECASPREQVVCERTMERTPRVQHVALRGDGRNCEMVVSAPPRESMLKADMRCGSHWIPLTISNRDKTRAIWVTIYENRRTYGDGAPILAAACWLPEESRMACVDRRKIMVRVEATSRDRGRSRSASCSEPVVCDTQIWTGLGLDMSTAYDGHYISFGAGGRSPCTWSFDR